LFLFAVACQGVPPPSDGGGDDVRQRCTQLEATVHELLAKLVGAIERRALLVGVRAGRVALDDEGREAGARRVDRRGEAGGAGTHDDDIADGRIAHAERVST